MCLRIVLADDHEIMREGLSALVDREPGLQVVAAVGDGRATVEQVRRQRPHVVVMDVGMPELNGIEATRQIRSEAPDTKVVALSIHADRRFVAGMLEAGASAYLLKGGAFRELVAAIRAAVAGQFYLSSEIAGVVVEDYLQHRAAADAPAPSALTAREREVLQLTVEGKTVSQIAAALAISEKTVGTHRSHLMEKLDIHTVAELTKYALREGLTFLDA